MKQFFSNISAKASDLVANCIATWKFVIIYTTAMLTWVALHSLGILTIDTMDFIRYNLFLSWAAGIQASIVLMTSNRQAEKDRINLDKGLIIDKQTLAIAEKLHKSDIQNIESIKKVRAKTHLDLASKSPLIEDVNLVQERQEKDPFMSLAQNILQKDRVSLAEAAPPTGSGLTRRIPGIKQGKGKGGKTSSRKRTSLYDYLL